MQPRDAYSRSIALFAEGLSGRARDLALARAAQYMAANAARAAATSLQRPAVAPSAHSSLRQVTPPHGSLANPHAFRTTPPIVMSAPHSSSTPAAGHGSWPMGRVPGNPAASAASPAAAYRGSHQQPPHQPPGGVGTASSMGAASSRDRLNAFGSPFTPIQQPGQQSHRALGSHGPTTAHSQYSHYRPPLSGLTVTSHGAGMSLPSIGPSGMHPVANASAGINSRPAAVCSGLSLPDPLKHSGAMSFPGHDRSGANNPPQASSRGPQGLPQGSPRAASTHAASDQTPSRTLPGQQQHQPNLHSLQQHCGPSPLGTVTHAVHQQMQQASSPLGQSSPYRDKSASIAPAEYRASSWPAQQPGKSFSAHQQQPGMHESRPGQNHPRLPASSAVQGGYSSSAPYSNPTTQPPSSDGVPMHEQKLPRGLAYGTSKWGL